MTATRKLVACPKPKEAREGWREAGGVKSRCSDCGSRVICAPESLRLREVGFEIVCRACYRKFAAATDAPVGELVVSERGSVPTPEEANAIVAMFDRKISAPWN